MNNFEKVLIKNGWFRSPNNIHGLQELTNGYSPIWYPGSLGMFKPPKGAEIQVCYDRIRAFTTKHFGKPYSRESYTDTVTVAVFENAESMIEWCRDGGEKVEIKGTNVWD